MKVINGQSLKKMLVSAANNLYNHYPEIDALNVFPVPDGDTGMNMNLTLSSGSKEIINRNDTNIFDIAKAFSRGLLMGARGNSGVITSQIFRGFCDALQDKEEINALELAYAFDNGRKIAYKAVIKPVEGTILTVIRESSAYLLNHVNEKTSIEDCLKILLAEAQRSLERTPNLLPVLKEVGVVDSGGAGLVRIFEGMYFAVANEFIQKNMGSEIVGEKKNFASEDEKKQKYKLDFVLKLGPDDRKKPFQRNRFNTILSTHGSDFIFSEKDNKIVVSIVTTNIGAIISYSQNYGDFETLSVITLKGDKPEVISEKKPVIENKPEFDKKFAIVATSTGDGINKYFNELGAEYIVSGGQTMNPSTEDFVKIIKETKAKNVFVLPNNSNIIMAANQAKDVLNDYCHVEVIPSKTILQGILACMTFSQDLSIKENISNMNEALSAIKSGSVTFSIKDTDINGIHVNKDEFMAIREAKNIIGSCDSKIDALMKLIEEMLTPESCILTVLFGSDVSEAEEVEVRNYLNSIKGVDFEIRRGDQPIYSFLVGVE